MRKRIRSPFGGVGYRLKQVLARWMMDVPEVWTLDGGELGDDRYWIRFLDADDRCVVVFEFDGEFDILAEMRVDSMGWEGESFFTSRTRGCLGMRLRIREESGRVPSRYPVLWYLSPMIGSLFFRFLVLFPGLVAFAGTLPALAAGGSSKQAVRAAGRTDSDAVVKALEAGAFPGVAGTYRFDASHQAVWGTPELHGNVIRWEQGGARIVFPVPEKR